MIAGDGNDRERLLELCRKLNLSDSVEFLGYLSPERLPEIWSRIQVQVVPSLWAEPFGLVASEAMACGRPVLATRGGGLNESVVDGETGVLVEPGNVGELADSLLALLNAPEHCKAMGRRGMDLCTDKFDVDRILNEHIEGYRTLVATHRSAHG
ncbi:MAG: glycosyltransferase family 4 protein [Planctomycetaceae bacterium]|nr:glycosyltransferase family 4 protein [Planctomycetaceae bacterium]